MTDEQCERMATAIVEHLFVNGDGDRAARLVLMAGGHDLGSWGELPLYHALLRILAMPEVPPNRVIREGDPA